MWTCTKELVKSMYSELGMSAECRGRIGINVVRDGSPAVGSRESCSKGLVAGVIRRRNGSQTEKPLPRSGGTRRAADTHGRAEGWGREEWQGCSLVTPRVVQTRGQHRQTLDRGHGRDDYPGRR